jgi:hypothetical protein
MQDILTQINGTSLGPGAGKINTPKRKPTPTTLKTDPGTNYEETSFKAGATYRPPAEPQAEMLLVTNTNGTIPGTLQAVPSAPPIGYFDYINRITYHQVIGGNEYFVTQ